MEGITPLTYSEYARKLAERQVYLRSSKKSLSRRLMGDDSNKKFKDFVVYYNLAIESISTSFGSLYDTNYDSRVWEWIYHPVVSIIITSYLNVCEDLDNWKNEYPPLIFSKLPTPALKNYEELYLFLTSDYGQQYICEYIIVKERRNIHTIYSSFTEIAWKKGFKKPSIITRFYRALQSSASSFSRYISLVQKEDEHFITKFEFYHFISNILKRIGFTYVLGTGFPKFLAIKRNSDMDPFQIKQDICLSGLLNTLIPFEYGLDHVVKSCSNATSNTHNKNVRWHLQDIFIPLESRIRIAISQANGASVFIYQHGGAYKVLRYHYHEFVERRLSNKWISAGSLRSESSLYESSSIVYSKFNFPLRSSSSINAEGPICIQLYDISKHEAFLNSEMNSRLMPYYSRQMRQLQKYMPMSVNVVVQYYHQKLAYFSELETIFKTSEFSSFEAGKKTAQIRGKVSLMILTYFSTTILEEINSNTPFVILVPFIEAYSEKVYPLLLEMIEVNLLFIQPEDLCRFIKDKDYLGEFYSKKTQRVVSMLREKLIFSREEYA